MCLLMVYIGSSLSSTQPQQRAMKIQVEKLTGEVLILEVAEGMRLQDLKET